MVSENVSRTEFPPYWRVNQQNEFSRILLVNILQSVSLLGQERNEVIHSVYWQFFLPKDTLE